MKTILLAAILAIFLCLGVCTSCVMQPTNNGDKDSSDNSDDKDDKDDKDDNDGKTDDDDGKTDDDGGKTDDDDGKTDDDGGKTDDDDGKTDDDDGKTDDDVNTDTEKENLIYGNGVEVKIIRPNSDYPNDILFDILNGFGEATGNYPIIGYDNDDEVEHEIVIGMTSRPISVAAYEALKKREVEEGEYRFLIYSDGSSVAIAYENDVADATFLAAARYFIANYIKEELILESGVAYRSYIVLSDYIDSEDEKFIQEKWAELEREAGAELTAAMKQLYMIFGDEVLDWFANLYDPGVGGYYFSNSGRDGQDFLPDIESTSQALGYVTASGMLMQTGESIADFIPEKMQKEIIAFAKSLQDPGDGYFYHPQWGKAIASSRKTRDLSWATGVLSSFGSAPTYDAPNGVKGDGILADGSTVSLAGSLSFRLGTEAVKAVSKVLAVSATDSRFESVESFLEYLEGRFGESGNQPIEKYSYVAGNELSTMCNVILARDKELEQLGEPTIAPVLIEWLNERQNELGHWHYVTDEDGNLVTDELGNYIPLTNYYANNGLLKIINVYNTLGYKMPRITEATETAVGAITSEEKVLAIVDIYNTWFCVNCIRRNLVNYGGNEGKAEYETLKERLYEMAPSALIVTRDKLATFLKIDGSFSQAPESSSSTSQNAPVAVPNTNEGDINATRIAVQTITDLYGSLGLSDYFVPIYTRGDAIRYRELLEDLAPFEKPTIEFIEPDVIDDSFLGSGEYLDSALSYDETTVSKLEENGYIGTNYKEYLLFDDNKADISANIRSFGAGAVLEFKNYHYQRDPMLMFNVMDKTVWDKNDSYIIETDFLYEYGTRKDSGDVFQMFLLTSRTNASSIWYDASIVIKYDVDSEKHTLSGFGVTDYTIDLGKWYNMRLEINDTRSGSASLKLYLNGELIGEKTATTSARQIDAFAVRHRFDVSDGRIFFDNTYVNSVNETGEVYVDPNNYIELPDYVKGSGDEADNAFGFTDNNAADLKEDGILGAINTGTVESGYYGIFFDDDDEKGVQYVKRSELDGDGVLEFGSKANGDPYLTFLNSGEGVTGAGNDSYVLEFDYRFDSLNATNGNGNYFVFYLSQTVDKYTDLGATLVINKNAYDEFYLALSGSTDVVKLNVGEWYNIRLEIKDTTGSASLTLKVNGITITTAELGRSINLGGILARFAWSERNGVVYFDNIYYSNIEE